MSGSWGLDPACLFKCCWLVHVGLFKQQMNISVKDINTDSGELSLLMCGASLSFTTFAGPTKGSIFVFLP